MQAKVVNIHPGWDRLLIIEVVADGKHYECECSAPTLPKVGDTVHISPWSDNQAHIHFS